MPGGTALGISRWLLVFCSSPPKKTNDSLDNMCVGFSMSPKCVHNMTWYTMCKTIQQSIPCNYNVRFLTTRYIIIIHTNDMRFVSSWEGTWFVVFHLFVQPVISLYVFGKPYKILCDSLQGTNISHLGKRKIIFKYTLGGDMLVPWRVCVFCWQVNISEKLKVLSSEHPVSWLVVFVGSKHLRKRVAVEIRCSLRRWLFFWLFG